MRVTSLIPVFALLAAASLAQADWISAQRSLADLSKANTTLFTKKNSTVTAINTAGATPVATVQFNGYQSSFGQDFTTVQDWSPYNIIQFLLTNNSSINEPFTVVVQFYQDPNNYNNDYTQTFTVNAHTTVHYVLTVNEDNVMPYGFKYENPVLSAANVAEYFGTGGKPLNSTWHWRLSYQGSTPAALDISDARLIRHSLNFAGIADAYGQYTDKTWTNKILTNADFATRLKSEQSDLAAHPGTGETLGTSKLVNPVTTLGKWTVVTLGNGMKFLQHPDGKLFWTVGLNAVESSLPTPIQTRMADFKSLPSSSGTYAGCYSNLKTITGTQQCYSFRQQNLMMKYGASYTTPWVSMVKNRLASWGINMIGIDSDKSLLNSTVPFTFDIDTNGFGTRVKVPIETWGPIPDPYDPTFLSWCESNFKTELAPYVANSNLMGVFVDNELAWGDMSSNASRYNVALGVLESPSTQPAKIMFVKQLQTIYPTIAALNVAWGTSLASFPAILTTTTWSPKYTAGQVADFQRFDTSFDLTYYANVRNAVRYAGLKSFYLGSKFADYNTEVVNAESNYADILCFNMYRYVSDVPWSYFNGLKKPVMFSEFAYTLRAWGTFGGPASMPGTTGRASAIQSFLQAALGQQNIVGAMYYCYADEPITGRWSDFENGGFGVVDVSDNPYQDTVNSLRSFTSTMYTTRGGTSGTGGTGGTGGGGATP